MIMTKTIEEAANKYADNAYYPAPDYGWYESDDEQMKEVLADTFKTGADYLMSLPLASRLTAEEKEQIRFAHKMAKDFAERVNPMSAEVFKAQYMLLESIFGSDFFKEGD